MELIAEIINNKIQVYKSLSCSDCDAACCRKINEGIAPNNNGVCDYLRNNFCSVYYSKRQRPLECFVYPYKLIGNQLFADCIGKPKFKKQISENYKELIEELIDLLKPFKIEYY